MKTTYTTIINTVKEKLNNVGLLELVTFWVDVLCFVFVIVLLFMYSFNLMSKPNSAMNIVIMLMISSTLILRIKKIIKELSHCEKNKAMKQLNKEEILEADLNPKNEQ